MNIESPRLGSAPLSDEEAARANYYALIGRLFYDAPDAALLAAIGGVGENARDADEGGPLAGAWKGLQVACRSANPEALKQEHDALFLSLIHI